MSGLRGDSEGQTSLEEIRRFTHGSCPIYEYIDLEILDSEPRIGRCRVEMTEATSNHLGTVHAGVQWMAAEAVGGVIALRNFDPRRYVVVVRSVEIEFERPARGAIAVEACMSEDEFQRIEALLEEVGKADFELDIVIETEMGRVTRAHGRYQLRVRER
jgi:acyl-coenzyme A thioesterase PaaI-like protein